MEIIRFLIHYGLHFIAPVFLAWFFYRNKWRQALLIMLATMFIDLDHLIAIPVFDPNRCSINYHMLHSYYAIVVYFVLFFIPKFRIASIGLLLHIITDYLDCLWIK